MANLDSAHDRVQAWLDELRDGNEAARAGDHRSILRTLARTGPSNVDELSSTAALGTDRRRVAERHVAALPRSGRSQAGVRGKILGFAAAHRTLWTCCGITLGRKERRRTTTPTAGERPSRDRRRAYAECGREPEDLEGWTRFHEVVEALPDDERQVFNLLWYEGARGPQPRHLLPAMIASLRRLWRSGLGWPHGRAFGGSRGCPPPRRTDSPCQLRTPHRADLLRGPLLQVPPRERELARGPAGPLRAVGRQPADDQKPARSRHSFPICSATSRATSTSS